MTFFDLYIFYNSYGDFMKKVIILLTIILLPYIIISTFYHEKKDTIFVKVKIDQKIVEIPLEKYIVGVVAGEMPADFNVEALKAQAVAARSYVLKKISNNQEVTNDTLTQVYLDKKKMKIKWQNKYEENIEKIKKAVQETKGEYLVYNNDIIEALFFSTSSGYTENSEEVFSESRPYLKSVVSSWDSISPVYQETRYFLKDDFCQKLDIDCQKIEIEIIEKTKTGRSKKIKVNDKIFTSSEFTKRLFLRSSFLTIEQTDDYIIIETKGYGHGVGMSQYGAQAMALIGYNYQEILKYYYQDVEIKKI